jgi:hypothetical protein
MENENPAKAGFFFAWNSRMVTQITNDNRDKRLLLTT